MTDNFEIIDFVETNNGIIKEETSNAEKKKAKLTDATLSALKKGLLKINDRRKIKYTEVYNKVVSESKDSTDSIEFDKLYNKLQKIGVRLKKTEFGIHRIECVQAAKPVNINSKFISRIKTKVSAFLNAGDFGDIRRDMNNAYAESKKTILSNEKNLGLEQVRNYDTLYQSFQNPTFAMQQNKYF